MDTYLLRDLMEDLLFEIVDDVPLEQMNQGLKDLIEEAYELMEKHPRESCLPQPDDDFMYRNYLF